MSIDTLEQSSTITFSQLNLAPALLQAVSEVGYEVPSPIQAQSIPSLMDGRDLLGQAQTGTGKTAAFALPLLSRLDLNLAAPQLLVLTPTRELAIQVAEAMQKYARYLNGFHVLPVYGGQGMSTQLRSLKRGVHAVVGTPGRILDHLRRGTLQLNQLSSIVLDEADEMLRMGFIDDVEEILNHTPETRQVALFSATMPDEIRRIARRHLKNPVEIRIPSKTVTVASINQRYWQVSGIHKIDALTRILEVEDFDAMIVFVRTKTTTAELAEKLEARGYGCAALNGDMSQVSREKTIENLKNGKLDIVIATDVAARGLNVERISHVINYDIPTDTEAYVHRIGRTGRAGRKGEAILFVAPREQRLLRAIEKATRQPITSMQLPTQEDIADKRLIQFKQTISDTFESQAEVLPFFENVIASYQQEHNIGLSEIASVLAYLVQRDKPLIPKKEPKLKKVEEFGEDRGERRGRSERGRSERSDRGERGERSGESRRTREREEVFAEDGDSGEPKKRVRKSDSGQRGLESGMVRYRIEVGRTHGAQPKHIVGAIANEAGLESRHIGYIEIGDNFSTVDLPDGMPKEVYKHLKTVWVCGQQLQLHPWDGSKVNADAPAAKPRSSRPPRTERSERGERERSSSSGEGKKFAGNREGRERSPSSGDTPHFDENAPRKFRKRS